MRARFGETVWWLRIRRRLSQEALAERARLHRSQISLIEGGRRSPGLPTIIALAGALEVPVENLFEGISYTPVGSGCGGYEVTPLDLSENRPRAARLQELA